MYKDPKIFIELFYKIKIASVNNASLADVDVHFSFSFLVVILDHQAEVQ